jgi:hypothetical protein
VAQASYPRLISRKPYQRAEHSSDRICQAGFTDQELADLFGVSVRTINIWKARHVDFLQALKAGKTEADDRVERALYQKAIGYSHSVETPMVVDKDVRIVTYTERMPPDTTPASSGSRTAGPRNGATRSCKRWPGPARSRAR